MDFLNKVIRLESVDSTNRFLVDLVRQGAEEGTVCVSEYQSEGRGRNSRHWESPHSGGLLCSVLFRPPLDLSRIYILPILTLLSILDSMRQEVQIKAALKWPNDVVYEGRKLGGMLSEIIETSGDQGAKRVALVVGFGINCAWPEEFSISGIDKSQGTAGNAILPITLAEITGKKIDKDSLLNQILSNIQDRYGSFQESVAGRENCGLPEWEAAVAPIMAEYRLHCETIGKEVLVQFHDRVLSGYGEDVTLEGRLVVSSGGESVIVDVGDIIHLRPI